MTRYHGGSERLGASVEHNTTETNLQTEQLQRSNTSIHWDIKKRHQSIRRHRVNLESARLSENKIDVCRRSEIPNSTVRDGCRRLT